MYWNIHIQIESAMHIPKNIDFRYIFINRELPQQRYEKEYTYAPAINHISNHTCVWQGFD